MLTPATPIKTNSPRRRFSRSRLFNVEAKIGQSRETNFSDPTLKSRVLNNRNTHPRHGIGKLVLSGVVHHAGGLLGSSKPSWLPPFPLSSPRLPPFPSWRGRPTVVSRPRATLRHTNSNPLETRGAGPTREPGPGKSMATRVLPAPQNSRRPARSRVGTPPIVRAVCMCPPARLLHAVERRFRRTGCFEPKLGAVFLNGGLLEGSRNHGHVGLSTGPQLRFVAYIPSVETPLLPKGLKPRAARPSGDGAGEEEDGEERGGEEGHTRQT